MNPEHNEKLGKLKEHLAKATSYDEWKAIALELDAFEGTLEWKWRAESEYYNYQLIRERKLELQGYLDTRNIEALARALREGLHHDLGNMGDLRLYQQCYFGTKELIHDYVDVVCNSIIFIADHKLPNTSDLDKLEFFKDILLSFGRPALLLSGGASLGAFHIGVVKALWEQDLLPQVINGSSAGAIVAAALGSRTDEELPELFDPHFHKTQPWKWHGISNGVQGKGFMDQKQLEGFIREMVGEYTMQEAFERTGRSVNISVSPVQKNQKPRLLSGYTSPYILMWSAALVSSAVPGLFPPSQLLKKGEDEEYVPYMPTLRWVDGTVVSDLPIERLRHLYDVNYTIVSQTNPHVVPFLDKGAESDDSAQSRWKKWPKMWAKEELKFHSKMVADYVRRYSQSELLKHLAGQVHAIVDQRYNGDVTISPNYGLKHYASVLSNPSTDFTDELILQGQQATWPRIAMIKTHSKISKTLEHCVAQLKRKVHAPKPTLAEPNVVKAEFNNAS